MKWTIVTQLSVAKKGSETEKDPLLVVGVGIQIRSNPERI
jgi:hypothetical protein